MNKKLYYRAPSLMADTFSETSCQDNNLSFVLDVPLGLSVHTEDVDVKIKCGIPLSEESITIPNLQAAEEFVDKLVDEKQNVES